MKQDPILVMDQRVARAREQRTATAIRTCERCHAPILTGQRYDGWTAQGILRSQHSGLVGCLAAMLVCLAAMLVRASRHLGG